MDILVKKSITTKLVNLALKLRSKMWVELQYAERVSEKTLNDYENKVENLFSEITKEDLELTIMENLEELLKDELSFQQVVRWGYKLAIEKKIEGDKYHPESLGFSIEIQE